MKSNYSYGVVYRITNLVNGKCYHGQTVNLEERWPHHLRGDSHCHAIRNALKKYGRENFKFEIVEVARNKHELDSLEVKYVKDSLSPIGYNIREGGANGRLSEDTKKKMSDSQKVVQGRPDVKKRNSEGVIRHWANLSPESRKLRLAAMKSAQNRPEVRESKRQRMIKTHADPKQKAKRSKALKKSWRTCSKKDRESRCKAVAAACSTDRYRRKMRKISLEVLSRPEVKAKMIEGQKASWNMKRRKRQSEIAKSSWGRPGEKEKRGAAISKHHRSIKGKKRLSMRRHRGESLDAWKARTSKA
jgi:group I intron endonuclease